MTASPTDEDEQPSTHQPLAPARLAQIKAMKFTTGINPACGVFATDTEQELYFLAARCWNALQEVLADHAHLTTAHDEVTTRLADWEGHPN
ncbi:hypothetical protein ACNYS0_21095 [Streptomyces sp. BH034]|uniref:hypothetical protein n=1 Tax=Streptomyces sp. BH034 TaxID=3402626 RepID=UPI003BB722DD